MNSSKQGDGPEKTRGARATAAQADKRTSKKIGFACVCGRKYSAWVPATARTIVFTCKSCKKKLRLRVSPSAEKIGRTGVHEGRGAPVDIAVSWAANPCGDWAVSILGSPGPGRGVGISLDGAGGVISAHDEGAAHAFPDPATKAPHIPGLVALDRNDQVRVGEEARTWLGAKGRGARLSEALATPGLVLGDVCRDSSEILAHFLRKLRTNAEEGSEQIVEEAVIAVPVSIDAAARETIASAASSAGLRLLGFAPRPVAISLASGKSGIVDGPVWVLDFQENLLDVSVLAGANEAIEYVQGSASTASLGAGTFTSVLKDHFLSEFHREYPGLDVSQRSLNMLDGFAVKALHALAAKTHFSDVLPFFGLKDGEPVDLTADLSVEGTNSLILPLVGLLERFLRKVCDSNGFQPQSALEVILGGLPARIPAVRDMLESVFARPLPDAGDPEIAASLGAAMIAAGLLGADDPAGTVSSDTPADAPLPAAGEHEKGAEVGYYEVLGVHSRATRDEIKRAYFRAVRRHPPESDPDGFKRVREAYDTLSDPKARAKHDAFMAHGDEIVKLFFQATLHRDADEPEEAERCLKRLLALAPDEGPPRNMLGLLQLHAKRWDDAVVTFGALTKKEPDVAVYWGNFGHAFLEKGDEAAEADRTDEAGDFYRRALECFQRGAALESFNASIFLSMAQVLSKLGDQHAALDACEKSLIADGREDFQDFDTFIFMCFVHLRRDAPEEIETIAERIHAVLPNEPEAVKYAAGRFVHCGFELIKVKRFQEAPAFMRGATIIDPDDDDLVAFVTHAEILQRVDSELRRFLDEDRVIKPIRHLALLYFLGLAGEEVEDRDEKIEGILKAVSDFSAGAALSSVRVLENEYPAVFSLNKEAFGTLKQVMTRMVQDEKEAERSQKSRTAATAQKTRNTQKSESSCFVATAAFGTAHEPVIDIYRRYRDEILVRSAWGRGLIAMYNVVGPSLAKLIAPRPRLRLVIARLFNRLAGLVERRIA